jgi:choline dehydrogenase-like flavoprotein
MVVERGGFSSGPRATVPYWATGLDESVLIQPVSAPNPKLNNSTFSVAVPAVVGGGSIVNGMAYMRGSREDYDSWEALGNPGWGWNGLLPYFRKSTTFAPPAPAIAARWNMTWDLSVYDQSGRGPLRATIPNFQYPDVAAFWAAWNQDPDVLKQRDIGAGLGPGSYWTPSSIDTRDSTRSSARKAYFDPAQARPNLQLLTGHTVDEILFQGLVATGVRIKSRANNSTSSVFARKEVILAAGAVQTPQLLQVSGIGPRKVLQAAGIVVRKDLAAVGANLQDHATAIMIHALATPSFPSPETIANNATYNATVWAEYFANRTGPIAAGSGSMAVLLSLNQLATGLGSTIANKLTSQNAREFLPSAYDDSGLLRGFVAQRNLLARQLTSGRTAASSFPFPGSGLAPAVMLKPTSRGTITLDPANPHGLPVVQFNTLLNPIDADVILAMVKHARAFWQGPGLRAALNPLEILPGPQFQSDAEIMTALTTNGVLWPSLAHPSGTCAMMPADLGGCVGPDLRVYGVKNLSVVDASILPMIPSAPLQATMYGVAEKAADVIRARA